MRKKSQSRSKSSATWLNEHVKDHYVQLAKKEHYRARSAFKLIEIDNQDKLFRSNMKVLDLGSAPGSWSQVAVKKIKAGGLVVAVDILPMELIQGVTFIQGDFSETHTKQILENVLKGEKLDLVMSDISPNMTGVAIVDQAKSYYLAELVLEFSRNHLKRDSRFLIKVFQGSGYQEYFKLVKSHFENVVVKKPQASRGRSTELYLLASNLRES